MTLATAAKSRPKGMEYLIGVSQELSRVRGMDDLVKTVRTAARELCGADGATLVLREGERCYYVDEDAIAPLWKGSRFPLETCISGWVIVNGEPAVIEDIYKDPRVPHEAYRPTFVKSLAMVPIRESEPLGAIGNYWAVNYRPTEEQVTLLRSLANLAAVALENVRMIEKLEKANHQLEDSLRARDEFLSIASHELRTPLASLKLQLQMLERDVHAGTRKISFGRLANVSDLSLRQIDNLVRLIENLLDVSRIRLNRIQLNRATMDFSQSVRDAAAQMTPHLKAAGCPFELDLADGLAGEWDETRIQQIVVNLLSNAVKYAPGATVKVSTSRTQGHAMLVVEDSGPGIKPEHQARVFERFEREPTSSHIGGLGLGLYITKCLADAHGGNIRLESREGKGARFTLTFPLRR